MRVLTLFVLLASALLLAVPGTAAAENPAKNLVLLDVADDGAVNDALAGRTGWQTLRGLNYQVLALDPRGGEPKVVPTSRTFRTLSKFRLKIHAYTDLYVYVLNVDRNGEMIVLLPETGETHLLVKAEKETLVPPDDTYFKFIEGPGRESFRIIASPTKLTWVNPRELMQLEAGDRLAAAEARTAAEQKSIRTKSISLLQEQQQGFARSTKSLVDKVEELARNPEQRVTAKNLELISVEDEAGGQDVFHASAERDSAQPIIVDLTLNHDPNAEP